MSEAPESICVRKKSAGVRAIEGNVSAASKPAREFRRRRGREAAEKAPGQAATVVDHDPCGELAREAGLIWSHVFF
jgi:hypothetical protein